MLLRKLFSFGNLELAWRRINTGSNLQYKRFFRDLYYAYENAIDNNLKDLQIRLKSGSYQAQPPTRIFLPKPSGLQRPITLLAIEDQIIWQAIGNVFAERLRDRRSRLELKSIFSNILQKRRDEIFFVKSWRFTYGRFQKKIEKYYQHKFRWIAHFDLAAFYETVCHELLMKVLLPREGERDFRRLVAQCLETWSSDQPIVCHKHGIPQGPAASDFLAECFLLPIDEILSKEFRYARYGDDIRLFASKQSEIRKAAVRLEVLCRNRGLIPQAKKYGIREVKSLEEAMGSLPSIAPPEDESHQTLIRLPAKTAIKKFREALEGRPQRIADKTRARYVLYHAEPCPKLTQYVAKLLLSHPEHIDAFIHYLNRCKTSPIIVRACLTKMSKTPYDYVKGELWHVLARMLKPHEKKKKLIDQAINVAKDKNAGLSAKWGACHFLCRAETDGLGKYSKFVQYQDSPLLQAILVPAIPDARYGKNDVISRLIRRTSFEPGIMLAEQFVKRRLTHRSFDCPIRKLPDQVKNVFRELGIIKSPKTPIDPMGEILAKRYGIEKWNGWRKFFGDDYVHSLQILSQGDAVFKGGRSIWLRNQNSFNHALFLKLQKHLHAKSLSGSIRLLNKKREYLPYGTLLDPNNSFSTNHPAIADGLRACNKRRNNLPESHPYGVSGVKTRWLRKREQYEIFKKLKISYKEVINLLK